MVQNPFAVLPSVLARTPLSPLRVQVTDWADADGATCSTSCGGGTIKQERTITVEPTPATQRPCFDGIHGGRKRVSRHFIDRNSVWCT